MGSANDHDTIVSCRKALDNLGISHEAKVLSAHRTPGPLMAYLETLPAKGTQVIVAAAGMAAHLAGVVAAHSQLPVLGLPIAAGPLSPALTHFSTVQMPGGVPSSVNGYRLSRCLRTQPTWQPESLASMTKKFVHAL